MKKILPQKSNDHLQVQHPELGAAGLGPSRLRCRLRDAEQAVGDPE
jgi:hypothetical protein